MQWWKFRSDSLKDEIENHIDLETQENIDSGMPPEDARCAALSKFGNLLIAREDSRQVWGWFWLEQLLADIGFSIRQLYKSPAFSIVAILTLALGIGANAAIFTLLNAVLMRNLPVADPRMLVRIGNNADCCVGMGNPQNGNFTLFPTQTWQLLRDNASEFEELAAMQAGFQFRPIIARRDGDAAGARSMMGEFVSGNYFRTFGLQPEAGQLLNDSDDSPGAPMRAVISYEAWQRDYGRDAAVVGSTFWINTKAVTIAGIAPEGFYGDRLATTPPDFYLPIQTMPRLANAPYVNDPSTQWLYLIGRVKPGVHLPTLQEKLSALVRQAMAGSRPFYSGSGKELLPKVHVVLTPGGAGIQDMRDTYRSNLRMLMAVSGLVLLIACANIANLLLARGMGRKAEISLRSALGAARNRIVRQLLTESIVLAVLSGVAGLVVAYAGTRMLLALAFPGAQGIPIQAGPSSTVLAFSSVLSVLTGIVFGVTPAWITARAEPAEALRNGFRTTFNGASALQRGLVVLQAALSVMLLIGAGLFAQSLNNLKNTDLKVETENRYIVHINPQAAGYSQRQVETLYRTIGDRFHAVPGIEQVGISSYTPMEDNNNGWSVQIQGRPDPNASASWVKVNSEYFDSVGTRVLAGRGIIPSDTSTSRPAAVVNQTFVKKFFEPGENPIGHHFGSPGTESTADFEIVGVVEDTVYTDVRWKDHPMYFGSLAQRPLTTKRPIEQDETMFAGAIVLKAERPISNLEALARQTLASINQNLTVVKFQTFDQQIADRFSHDRLISRITMLFGALALLLATVGLYGVTAYTVACRTNEIGIRMALGAKRTAVIAMVAGGAMIQTALGLAIGIPAALFCWRFVQTQLYDVSGMDAGVMATSILTLVAAASIAALIPARRAASIDPAHAVRME